jgi:hypothetical protein
VDVWGRIGVIAPPRRSSPTVKTTVAANMGPNHNNCETGARLSHRPGREITMDAETHLYHGYRIFIERYRKGWRSMICPPNSERATPGPPSDDVAGKQHVLDEAKATIDRQAV